MVYAFRYSIHECIAFFPFLVLLCLFFISFTPLRRPGNLVLSFLFLFVLSSLLLSAGVMALDTLSVNLGKAKLASGEKVKLGQIEKENEFRSWYATGLTTDGKAIQGLIKVDFQSPNDIIAIREKAAIPEMGNRALPAPPPIVNSIVTDAAGVNSLLRRSGFGQRIFTAIVIAFFFCTLWLFPRLSSWPLFGALLSLLVFRLSLLFTALTASKAFSEFAREAFPPAAGIWLPQACLLISGALLLGVDILVSAIRRRSQPKASGGPA
jgi:hypothetical protein